MMRGVLLAVLLLAPVAQADVEMLFHGERIGYLHPDGQRIDAPSWTHEHCGVPLGGPVSFHGAWTVDPPYRAGGPEVYGHGDHGFGHSFNITSDAHLRLPVATGAAPHGPLQLEVTLWRGDYHLAWHGLDGDEEPVAATQMEVVLQDVPTMQDNGTTVYLIEAVLPTAGLRIDIQDGILLEVRLSPSVTCDPMMRELMMHAGAAWPSLSFSIADHIDVRSSDLQVHDEGLRGWIGVQHWQGPAGLSEQTLRIGNGDEDIAFVVAGWQMHDAYHHGIAPLAVHLPGLLLADGEHELHVSVVEDGEDAWSGVPLSWSVREGTLVSGCVRQPVGSGDRHDTYQVVCTEELGEEVPGFGAAPGLAVLVALLGRR